MAQGQTELVIPETIDEEPPPNILRKITTFISGGSNYPNQNFAAKAMRKISAQSGFSAHLRKSSMDVSRSSADESGRSDDLTRTTRKFRTRPLKSRSISASDNLKGIQKISLVSSEKSSPNSVRSSNRSNHRKFSHTDEDGVKTRSKMSKNEDGHMPISNQPTIIATH